MEKVSKMPKLTPQEIREQKEREYGPRGEVIANKYLAHALRNTELEVELGKYQGDVGPIVRESLLSALCHSILLDDQEKSRRAIDGVRSLTLDLDIEGITREFEDISSAFNQAKEKTYSTFEESQKEILRKLGISGSAVRPNVTETEDRQNDLKQMRAPYDLRIDQLKEKLLCRIQS